MTVLEVSKLAEEFDLTSNEGLLVFSDLLLDRGEDEWAQLVRWYEIFSRGERNELNPRISTWTDFNRYLKAVSRGNEGNRDGREVLKHYGWLEFVGDRHNSYSFDCISKED